MWKWIDANGFLELKFSQNWIWFVTNASRKQLTTSAHFQIILIVRFICSNQQIFTFTLAQFFFDWVASRIIREDIGIVASRIKLNFHATIFNLVDLENTFVLRPKLAVLLSKSNKLFQGYFVNKIGCSARYSWLKLTVAVLIQSVS